MTSLTAEVTRIHDGDATNFISTIQNELKKYGHKFIDLTFDSVRKTFTVLQSKPIAKGQLQQLFDRISIRENSSWTAAVVCKTDKEGNHRFYLTKSLFYRWCTKINVICLDVPSKICTEIDESFKRLMQPEDSE